MKKFLYSVVLLSALTGLTIKAECNSCNNSSCGDCCDNTISPCSGYPFLQARSQGRNSARELAGWEQFINQENNRDYSGAFYTALEYGQTFKPCQLSQFLFGSDVDTNCCCNELLIQGSQVADRNPKAWLADYFGLSPAFESSVCLCPKIQNVVLDLNWIINLDKWTKGLFVRLDMPIAWTQYDLGMHEIIKNDGSYPAVGFAAGYMDGLNDLGVNRNVLPDSFTQAMSGTVKFGAMQEPIKFGKMTPCKLSKAGIADLRMTLGYNFIQREDGHFGLFAHLTAPTGNAPKAWYLFEPIIGNGKHWELGAGLTTSWIFHRCKSKSDDRYLGLYLDATVSHLFKTQQCRSFDFNCKSGSRYMLLEEMGANTGEIQADINGVDTLVDYAYKNSLIPAINWSTFCVDVSIAAQADATLKIVHVRENWNFDLGYNFWARSGEKFCQECCNNCCDNCNTCTPACTTGEKQYAIKGDAYLWGFDNAENAYELSATQSEATIHGGKNYPVSTGEFACTNPRIDNPFYALDPAGVNLECYNSLQDVKTSQPSILATKNLLNMCQSPSAITHKVFININYAWKDTSERYLPFLGIGSELEFAQGADCCKDNCSNSCNSCNTCNTCNTDCNSCDSSCNSSCNNNCDCGPSKKAGISQWGLWLKGGVKFD